MALTIVFDFDGTLHDTMAVYPDALRRGYQLLVDRGLVPAREIDGALAAAGIGLAVREAWEQLCPELPWSVTGEAAALVGDAIDELIVAGEARLYPGVPEMLQCLVEAGHRPVFLSNCRNAYLAAVRQAFGLDAWFDHYYTAEQFGGIPKEEIFETIRREVPGPYVVVGDRDKDRALAAAHGLPFIGCAYGYGAREELEGADYLAEEPLVIVHGVELVASR